MKKPQEVKAIIGGIVYTVPTYTNVDGKMVNGKNATIKFYDEATTSENTGVKPLSLVAILIDHFNTKSKKEEVDEIASSMLSHLYDVIEEMDEEQS